MSLNLKEEILKLSSTAPVYKDQDDDFYDETTAKIESKSNEFNDDFDLSASDNRRIRPAVADLSEYGQKYKGKKVSRKNIKDFESDEEDFDEGEENEDEEDEGDDDDEDEDEEEEEEEEDDEELDEEDDEEEEENEKPKKRKASDKDDDMKVFTSDRDDEIQKGKIVKNQLELWELLLETRVKLQNVLNVVNKFPQFNDFNQIAENLKPDLKKTTEDIMKENKAYLNKTFNQFAAIQQRLFQSDPETHYMIQSSDKNKTQTNKRKRTDNGDQDNEAEKEQEDDHDDEEIFSDTDEEAQANERKKQKSKLKNIEFKPIKPDHFESYLENTFKNFQKYRNSTIQKWYDKTRLVTTKSFQSFEKPILQQIEHLLTDRERLIKRTQLKRSIYDICGKAEAANEVKSVEELKDRHLKDYDEEIFDDQDFYNQLMRELIDRQTSNVLDPVELARKSIELQNLRNKSKKKVDTKASKGRKIRYNVHKQLVNFMAPIYRTKMSEEARNELFHSLFADHIKLLTSNDSNGKQHDNDIDFNCLFKDISSSK